jgi:sugar phosphate isomerase/epimerase
MKTTFSLLVLVALLLDSCSNAHKANNREYANTSTTVNPADWKFGVALWTFHTVDFAKSLDEVDSAGIQYIEPNTFHKSGPALKDSLILQLSPAGIDQIKSLITQKGLKCESVYIVGDATIGSWVKQFEIAKRLGVKFVTTEPPLSMWDSIDSLAGVYNMKVAIHEHWKGFSHYWNPDTTLMAMKGHPNFGVCADLGHWPKSGVNPLEAVKKLKGHIISVHLKDIAAYNNPSLRDVPVGTGVVDFPAIFKELKNQGFKGYVYIERDAEDQPNNLPSVIQEKKYYNDLVKSLR